jgi:chaperonin GroEL
VALVNASPALDKLKLEGDEKIGVEIIRKALEEPLKTIASNAGFEGSVVAERIKGMKKGEGLNSATGEYGDLVKMGVIDPVKVTRSALQNAASIAALILITETTVTDVPVKEDAASAAAMAGMGGGMY